MATFAVTLTALSVNTGVFTVASAYPSPLAATVTEEAETYPSPVI
jgi:hypothetical protein